MAAHHGPGETAPGVPAAGSTATAGHQHVADGPRPRAQTRVRHPALLWVSTHGRGCLAVAARQVAARGGRWRGSRVMSSTGTHLPLSPQRPWSVVFQVPQWSSEGWSNKFAEKDQRFNFIHPVSKFLPLTVWAQQEVTLLTVIPHFLFPPHCT